MTATTPQLEGTTPTGPAPDLGPVSAGTTVDVEHVGDEVVLRVTPDPDDPDAAARLLCAAVSHVRRRHARRAHLALHLGNPAHVTLLEAVRSRVGTDIAGVDLRRAGASVMVTLDLLPVASRPVHRELPAGRPPGGDRRRGRDPHLAPPARTRGARTVVR